MESQENSTDKAKMNLKTVAKTMAWLRKIEPERIPIVPVVLDPVTEVVVS